MEPNSANPLRLSESPHKDDDSGGGTDEKSDAVPTARYVEGTVGLARGGWHLHGASHRRGTLVIEIGGGDDDDEGRSGTLRFFSDGISGWRADGGACGYGSGSGSQSGVTVRAIMERYVEPPEEPYLRIPPAVPWKFEAMGDNSFNIVVPPLDGRMDHRVELRKPSHMLKKMKLGLDDKDPHSNESLDGVGPSSEIVSAESSNKGTQVFKFHCREGELAVYGKAAQSLRRNLNKYLATKVSYAIKTKQKVRTRTEAGIEIAAQSALIDRSVSVKHVAPRRLSSFGEEEFRIAPHYCYPNTWMTKKDIAIEVKRTSSKFHDLRNGHQDEIGSLKIEVLQCCGLPKMDRYGLTDAYCFIVSGSSAFVTDVIPENCNPCWLPLSKRACILPIFNAYSQVYVGVFDYDGEKSKDDFAGRIVIDIPKLQPGRLMDITLPLRQFSHVHKTKKLGSIRLRLKLDWAAGGERAALLSYLPRDLSDVTRRIRFPSKPVTVACPDAKSFSNVALTVYGKDIPGRFSKSMMSEATQEQMLMRDVIVSGAKEIAAGIVSWKTPLLSFYIFCGWMHSVANGPAFVPVWTASLLLIFMLKNYLQYHINSATANLYGRRTISGMTKSLLFKHGCSKDKISKNLCSEKSSLPMIERMLLRIFGMSPVEAHPKESDSWKFEDNSEFPFSDGYAHPKQTSDDAAAEPLWEAAQDESAQVDCRKSTKDWDSDDDSHGDKFSPSDFDSDDEGEFSHGDDEIDHATGGMIKQLQQSTKLRKSTLSHSKNTQATTTHADVGLQDEIAQNNAGSGGLSSVKFQIDKWQALTNRATFHLFDERVYVADRADAEKLLQIYTGSNPIKRMVYPLMADVIKLLRTDVSACRAIFNILYFKDPMLSYWAMVLVFCSMIILLIFPWQKFLFALGLLGLGPQNYFFEGHWNNYAPMVSGHFGRHHTTDEEARRREGGKTEAMPIKTMDISKSPLLMRNNLQAKPDDKPREIIVPSIPFRYNRFYDWPPDPALATIK